MKICTICAEEKELQDFGSDKRARDGKSSSCKACNTKRTKKWKKV